MKLENLKKYETLNSREINVIQGGLAAASTVESQTDDSDVVSSKKDGNTNL
jgi:hypothetical protein